MAVGDIFVFKRTVIVPKQGSISEQTITTGMRINEVDASLVLRNSSNGFYKYDVVITGKQVTPQDIEELKFIITNSQDDEADVTGVLIGTVGVDETLLATDTVKTDTVNNILSTHTLSVYADMSSP